MIISLYVHVASFTMKYMIDLFSALGDEENLTRLVQYHRLKALPSAPRDLMFDTTGTPALDKFFE